jgi:hypothetical protein
MALKKHIERCKAEGKRMLLFSQVRGPVDGRTVLLIPVRYDP